jgi:preprotein translocase subunit YajC
MSMTCIRYPLALLAVLALLPLGWIASPAAAADNKGSGALVDTPPVSNTPAAPEAAKDANAPSEVAAPAEEASTQPAPQRTSPFGSSGILLLMVGVMAVMWFFSSRSRRKQEAKRREMLSSLKKGDKVTSIGGIVGTVMEVREDEVMVKVDESNNTRMKFARWAIRGVGEEAKTEGPEDKK